MTREPARVRSRADIFQVIAGDRSADRSQLAQARETRPFGRGTAVALPVHVKNYILTFAVIGLVGCFLPLVGGHAVSLFDLHRVTWGAWLIVAAFAAPALAAWRGTPGVAALVALAGFGYLGLRLGPHSADLVLRAGIGGKLIGVAVVGGLIATVRTLCERE
jgi:hypothetical protein